MFSKIFLVARVLFTIVFLLLFPIEALCVSMTTFLRDRDSTLSETFTFTSPVTASAFGPVNWYFHSPESKFEKMP